MDARTQAILSRIKPPLKVATMLAEIIDITVGESQAGNPQMAVRLAPVTEDRAQRDFQLRLYPGLPKDGEKNPQVLGKLRERGYSFLSAVGAVPTYPKKVGTDRFMLASGDVVDYKQSLAASVAIDVAVMETLKSIKEQGDTAVDSFKGKRVFMKPQKAEFDADSLQTTQFVSYVTAELRNGETYITKDFVDTDKQAEFLAAAGL